MKKRLNILCVIVILVLSYPVIESCYYLCAGFKAGYDAAALVMEPGDSIRENYMQKMQDIANMRHIELEPEGFTVDKLMNESVINAKTGEKVSVSYSGLLVGIKTNGLASCNIITGVVGFLNIGLCIWAIVLFIKLLLAINRLDVFSWNNVRRLRRIGLALIGSFLCQYIAVYLTYKQVEEVFALDGYQFSLTSDISMIILVLGLCALIVGEVFAIGLKMKEEQELTI